MPIILILTCCTGCDQKIMDDISDKWDYPYFGENTDNNGPKTPYSNKESYVLSEFDNKEVTIRQIESYDSYDTAGPANYGITPDTQAELENENDSTNTDISSGATVTSDSSIASKRNAIVNYAKQFLGKPYLYGGTWSGGSTYTATDCSGFVQGLYQHYGVSITRSTSTQAAKFKSEKKWFTPSSVKDLRKGDLIYYASSGTPNHVAMYIGGGQIIHASNRRDGVKIGSNWQYKSVYGVARVWGEIPG